MTPGNRLTDSILTLILSFQRLNVLSTAGSSLGFYTSLVCGETPTHPNTQSSPAAFTFGKVISMGAVGFVLGPQTPLIILHLEVKSS